MSGSANNSAYGHPPVGNSPWGPGPTWNQPPWGYWRWHMVPRPLCIAAVVLGFIFWWPIGLVLLLTSLWSGRMGCGRHGGDMSRWQQRMADKWDSKMERWGREMRGFHSSGNHVFDDYREETLRRLEEEQREFREFLQRLRMARDKAEFDQFMTERRNRPEPPPAQSPNPV